MISLRRRAPTLRPTIDPRTFRAAMSRPVIVRELFLSLDDAWWDGSRFTLGKFNASPRPIQRGVRIQEPRPDAAGPQPERDTQNDLCALFASITELRKAPELSELVLSEEALIGKQNGAVPGKRVVFGLHCEKGGPFQAEARAAGECYRVVRRTVERAGYRVEHPKEPFSEATGFSGLQNWAAQVRLRRKPDWRPWLLLLLLIPLFFLLRSCEWQSKQQPVAPPPPAAAPPDTLFRVPVESESFIILLDKSGSMGPYFSQVRDEARRLLQERSRDPAKLHFADLIVYDAETESVLGDLKPVSPEGITRITNYLNDMKAGGWTNLAVAIDLASKEVVRHKQKTTLIVITDGEDKTIPKMIRDKKAIIKKFGDVPFTVNAITPRLFAPGADPRPAGFDEEDLAELCKCFNGRFGPVGAVP
jgi:hypothetical protein